MVLPDLCLALCAHQNRVRCSPILQIHPVRLGVGNLPRELSVSGKVGLVPKWRPQPLDLCLGGSPGQCPLSQHRLISLSSPRGVNFETPYRTKDEPRGLEMPRATFSGPRWTLQAEGTYRCQRAAEGAQPLSWKEKAYGHLLPLLFCNSPCSFVPQFPHL